MVHSLSVLQMPTRKEASSWSQQSAMQLAWSLQVGGERLIEH